MKHLLNVATICLVASRLFSADLLVDGSLKVTGDADIEGNVATIGSWVGDPTSPGLTIQYVESSGSSVISFDASRELNTWLWRKDTTTGVLSSMKLDSSNKWTLFKADGLTEGVRLDPEGQSAIEGDLVVRGVNNLMPNQTLTGDDSVLTRSLADGRYLRSSSSTLVYGTGASATSLNSVAIGENASAEGNAGSPSIAIGIDVKAKTSSEDFGSIAIGWGAEAGTELRGGAVAIGQLSKAYGLGSIAMGLQARTESYGTIAIGTCTLANEGYAISIGFWSEASGYESKTFGSYTVAKGFAQTVIGRLNIIDSDANPFNREPTDRLFVIGNGTTHLDRSNAFDVKWNGETTVHGDAIIKKDLTVEENARFNGAVRVPPGGGLSMGEFTYDPEAQP